MIKAGAILLYSYSDYIPDFDPDEEPEGCTTVGGHIESSHLRPSKIGDVVRAEVEVTKVDGKKIEFKVTAYYGDTLLG